MKPLPTTSSGEQTGELLQACRMRAKFVALADWEPEMVAYLGGSAYHVRSYVDAGPDTLQLRRIQYECRATRRGYTDWRIDELRASEPAGKPAS
jgi:hypothetical protein